jgi:hypothetical protein
MLMHPYLNVPYDPSLGHFLGGFDIYDREESLGVELSVCDPECPSDRELLISRFIVKQLCCVELSAQVCFVLCVGGGSGW